MTRTKLTPRAEQGTDAENGSLRLSFWCWGRVLFMLASVYLAVRLIGMFGGFAAAVLSVLLFVVFGGVVAVVASPLHRVLRRAMPNSVAAAAALVLAVIAVAGLAYVVGLQIVSTAHHLTAYLPRLDGPITATVAFQELAFMTLLGLGVLPRVITSPGVGALVLLMLAAHAAVVLVLSWEPAYTRARVLVERIRILRRFDKQLRELRPAFMQLWDVRTAAPIFALQAIAAALSFFLFFLALQALGPRQVSFMTSTFVLSLSHLLAGLSLIPGGLGAFEGLLTILLLSNGVPAAGAAAAAILYRGYEDVIVAAAEVPFALRMRQLMRERRPRSSRHQRVPARSSLRSTR